MVKVPKPPPEHRLMRISFEIAKKSGKEAVAGYEVVPGLAVHGKNRLLACDSYGIGVKRGAQRNRQPLYTAPNALPPVRRYNPSAPPGYTPPASL